jgi:hypothetical protein
MKCNDYSSFLKLGKILDKIQQKIFNAQLKKKSRRIENTQLPNSMEAQ